MDYLVFETPGEIERDAFSLMGANVKLHDSAIGRFGTGLKYAVACLARWGDPMAVQIGSKQYTFEVHTKAFRDKPIDRILMRRGFRAWSMPYTTAYGRDWLPWMVVRELESNTRDESGRSWITTSPPEPTPGITRIIVYHQPCVEAYRDLDSIFLPGASREGEGVQVFETPSKHIYWRSLRVYTLDKEAQRTYNILDDVPLTEDRTLSGEFYARYSIAKWTIRQADIPQVKSVITAKPETFEGKLDLDIFYEPSEAFHECMALEPKGVRTAVTRYYEPYSPRRAAFAPSRPMTLSDYHPGPWSVSDDQILDKNNKPIFDKPEGERNWSTFTTLFLQRFNGE